ncbi:hypothetical protein TWF696_007652 [Orbilia brochopaga]|uniref:Uncharacterized protein n=1 Tax=Orbilia brochopaga TaxID=3140254 RepID=A0AAV9UP63_9PEZI
MLLSARDQENRVLHGGTQNGKSQFPKTPGQGPSKTPFAGKKIALRDENGAGAMMAMGGGKSAFKAHADAFMTPVAPKSRVPLGGKDTNVKAKQTISFNDPLQQTTKPNKAGPPSSTKQTTRARRQTRLSITAAKPIVPDDDEFPEIEYIPPAPKDLPDDPDDYVRINVGIIKQTLFRDATSTPLHDAKRRERFQKLTQVDEEKEEQDLLRRVEQMVDEMRRGTEQGQEYWNEILDEDFNKNATIRGPKESKRATVPTSTYTGATKASLAKRAPPRPASAQSSRSAASTGTVRKLPASTHIRKPSATNVPRPRPATGLVPPISKHGDYHNAVGRKLGPIYHDEIREAKRKIDSGECGIQDIDFDELEERALRESEKKVSEKEDIEQKMRELFRMDEDEDEVYQIPLDF